MRGRRLALLVATSLYGDPGLRALRAPVGEVEPLRDLLLEQGGFDRVELLMNESKSQIERKIDDLLQECGPDDLALLYLSCHGIKNDSGTLLFAACNTELSRPDSTAVESAYVQARLDSSQARYKVVLLDCCYAGAFTSGLVAKSADAPESVDLNQLSGGRGTYVMTATNALEYAYEGEHLVADQPMASSLFTRAVLEGIRTGRADENGDGWITGDELYTYVHRELEGTQTPSRVAQMAGDFVIASASPQAPKPVQPETDRRAPVQATMGELLEHPLVRAASPAGTTMRVALGTTLDAHSQPFLLDLSRARGHLAAVGGMSSGKTMLLRSFLLGLAWDSVPEEVRFFCIDSDSRFGAFGELPHTGAVVGPEEGERIEEIVLSIESAISARRAMFRTNGIDSDSDFRRARRNGQLPAEGPHPDLFLIIDRWESFADDNPALVDRVRKIAANGLSFGVHVVVAARHRSEIPDALQRQIPATVEFALEHLGREGAAVARLDGEAFALALPRLAGDGVDDLHQALVEAVGQRKRDLNEQRKWTSQSRRLGLVNLETFDPNRVWRGRSDANFLRIPIGLDQLGHTIELDLKGESQGGTGPHGIVFGEPGSGTTQTVRAIVLALICTHSPSELNVVLLNPLSDRAYISLRKAPHVASWVDKGPQRLGSIEDSLESVQREIGRRRRLQAADGGSEPWPIIVVGFRNFEEAVQHRPGMADVLRAVMRDGGAVGVHVVLSSHSVSLDGMQDQEILERCGFRILHRTRGTDDSRIVLGSPEAADLPANQPGAGIFARKDQHAIRLRVWFPDVGSSKIIEAMNERASLRAKPLRSPLADTITLDEVLGFPRATEDRGLSVAQFDDQAHIPIGIVDLVAEGRTAPFLVEIGGIRGNIAISGPAYSGKAYLLRTIMAAAALTRTPEEIQFYCIVPEHVSLIAEFARCLPHSGVVAEENNADLVRAVVRDMTTLLRNRMSAEESADDPWSRQRGTVYLVVERWFQFAENLPDLVSDVERLIREGSQWNINVVLSAESWQGLDRTFLEYVRTRLDLSGPEPGIGTCGGQKFRAALPWLHDDEQATTPGNDQSHALAQRIASAWPGPTAPAPRVSPVMVSYQTQAGANLVLGPSESNSQWAEFDPSSDGHFLCLGAPGSGKTALLRVVVAELNRIYGRDVAVLLFDPKLGMIGEFDYANLRYIALKHTLSSSLDEVARELDRRLAPEQPACLPGEQWPYGKKLFVAIDNFELVGDSPVLERIVREGGPCGVHLILTRNSINAGPALNEGILRSLRERGVVVVLSGDERDGELFPGVPATERPPGRGLLLRKDHPADTIQIAWKPPEA